MRSLVIAAVSLALAGCVTASNTLSPDQVRTFRLTKVDVSVPEGASVRWGEGEVAYAATKGVGSTEASAVAETPEGRAFVRSAVASKLRDAFQRELGPALPGSRPVRLDVAVRVVEISPAIQRILIGGDHSLRADVTLVDAKTGEVLVRFPEQTARSMAGQGLLGTVVDAAAFDAPIDRVVGDYAEQYRRWLLKA